MKLRTKLMLGTLGLALSLWPVAWYAERTSRSALEQLLVQRTARQAGDVLEDALRVGSDRLRELQVLVRQPQFRSYLVRSNADFERMPDPQGHIRLTEAEWGHSSDSEHSTGMREALESECASALLVYQSVVHEEHGYAVFGELFVTNRYGANVGQTGPTTDYFQADEEWWRVAEEDGVFVGDAAFDESAGLVSTDICLRVLDSQGEFIGVLKAVLDMQGITTVLESRAKNYNARFALINEQGQLLYDTGGGSEELTDLEVLSQAPLGERNTRSLRLAQGTGGVATVAAMASRYGAAPTALQWKVLVETPTSGVLEPSRRLGRKIRIASWLVTGVGALLGLLLSLTVSRRVEALCKATHKIKEGQFGYRIEDDGTDELSDLARRFNAMASALESAQLGVEAARRAKNAFLANMSHEIRTPITATIGAVDLLMQTELGESERIEHFQTIRTSSQHLVSLITGILDLSQIEASELEIESLPCSPALIAQEVVELLAHLAIEKGLVLSIEFDSPIPACMGSDPTRIRQVLVNLVGNAIKFTSAGSVTIHLGFRPGPGPCMTFRVVDTGVGIDREQLEHVFLPFEQADTSTSRLFGGTGLGLTISRKLAQALGGDLVAQSEGGGSTFTLTIRPEGVDPDRLIERSQDILQHSTPQDREVEEWNLEGVRVLLADDVPLNRKLIAAMLFSARVEVEVAENGRIALAKVSAAQAAGLGFDVILMDLMMPELDGWSATQSLRESGYTGPIVAFTADALRETFDRCKRSGFDEVVTKPVRRTVLLEAIQLQVGAKST